jgi:hypothetical protein
MVRVAVPVVRELKVVREITMGVSEERDNPNYQK